MSRQQVIEQVADWIDTHVIAEMIVDHLEEHGEDITVERAKEVWLNSLENLGGGIGLAV